MISVDISLFIVFCKPILMMQSSDCSARTKLRLLHEAFRACMSIWKSRISGSKMSGADIL